MKNTYSLERQADSILEKHLKKGKKVKIKRRVPQIPKMGYRKYMSSPYWTKRKSAYFSKNGKSCAVCKKRSGVTLHHKIYNNALYGKEPDEHLVALCHRHHSEFHRHHKLSGNMMEDTNIYIRHARQFMESTDDLSWI